MNLNTALDLHKKDMKFQRGNSNAILDKYIDPCKETHRSNIVNRNFLSRRQYIKLLSQPRKIAYLSNIVKLHKKHNIIYPSLRLHLLSLPPKWKILNNWEYYRKILPSHKFERMIEYMLKRDIHLKIPTTYSYKKYIRFKNRRKFSQKIHKHDLEIFHITSSLANNLMTINNYVLTGIQKKIFEYIISYIIDTNLWKYECKRLKMNSIEMEFIRAVINCVKFVNSVLCKINELDLQCFKEQKLNQPLTHSESSSSMSLKTFDNNKDNFDEKKENDKSKEEKKSVRSAKSSKKSNVSKERRLPAKISESSGPTGSTESQVSSILKRIIDGNDILEKSVTEAYVQTIITETTSKFTSTSRTCDSPLLICDRNERLLLEIRKFYQKRADLRNKHVFDDVLLPKITLNEIMKYAELVLTNQAIATNPTVHLQNAFQAKIVQWVNEIVTLDEWDECMECDIKLLSRELARYITEEKNSVEVNTLDPEYSHTSIPNKLEIITPKIRGTDLNVQHILNITPHKPGVLCCASLKVWSTWVKDVAENAKLWCIWINQIISNMTYLSAIMRGEIYDNDGKQLSLFTCDWKQFIFNLDDDIIAWRQYNNHIQNLTDQLTVAFHGKRIRCCRCCKEEDLHISDLGIQHFYCQLFDAMETTKNWRHWLQDMVNEAKKLTCISENKCLCHIPIFDIYKVSTNSSKNQNVYNRTDGCPLVSYEQVFVEKDPSIYSIEHWT